MFGPYVGPWELRNAEVDVGSVAGSGDKVLGLLFV